MKFFKKKLIEKKLKDDLRKKIKHFTPLTNNNSEADNVWISYRNKLRSYILHKNLRNFLRWDLIRGTMYFGNPQFIKRELNFLKSTPSWSRYNKALIENDVGSPILYDKDLKISGNLIHQMYHISQFEVVTGTTIDKLDCVLEFGGGYGCMCRLFYNLGFKGKYIIFDLEEFSALQEYYLKVCGLKVIDSSSIKTQSNFGIICMSNSLQLKHLLENFRRTLFLATWSISETSIVFRDNFFKKLPVFNNYFVAYQKKFKEANNLDFFSAFASSYKRKNLSWKTINIPHLKDNFYLIGSGKT